MPEKEMRNKFGDLISPKQDTDKKVADQNKIKPGDKVRDKR